MEVNIVQKTLREAKRAKKLAKKEKKRLRAEKTAGIVDPDPSEDVSEEQQQQQQQASDSSAPAPGTALSPEEVETAIIRQNIRRNRAKKVIAVLESSEESKETPTADT